MKVRCIGNDISAFPNEVIVKRLQKCITLDGPNYDLIIEKEYNVQAIENRGDGWWYYIHSVEVNSYPYPYPCEFFEVINLSIETGWSVAMGSVNEQISIKRISFIEWATDDNFYEKLVDDDPECLQLYLKRKA